MTVIENSIVQHIIQNKNGIIKHSNVHVKTIISVKNLSTCICENSKYFKSVVNTSVSKCDEIVIGMHNLSTKKINTTSENNEFKEVHIKNRMCYYFDYIIKLEDFNLDNILITEKSHENILIYDISYKTLIDPKPLGIRFFKIDGVIRIYDGTRYLTLFGSEKDEAVYNRIRYLISQKCGITYIFSHYFAKIKVDSCDFLPI